ncbi:Aste57867_972 [Aphanomyces stellatus]|uniref:Aste57867_972 protein n=1 Tax=Aphanomyces stellatus TaxID=120398 RepID=A0A485K840_9STRA|nr:hypothetical protein As57867_000971 [Aphanomyces stellatus]VFT78194.1 Aste57867_972 [Aphanomyces stellatus]
MVSTAEKRRLHFRLPETHMRVYTSWLIGALALNAAAATEKDVCLPCNNSGLSVQTDAPCPKNDGVANIFRNQFAQLPKEVTSLTCCFQFPDGAKAPNSNTVYSVRDICNQEQLITFRNCSQPPTGTTAAPPANSSAANAGAASSSRQTTPSPPATQPIVGVQTPNGIPPPVDNNSSTAGGSNTGAIVAGVVGGLVAVGAAAFLLVRHHRRRRDLADGGHDDHDDASKLLDEVDAGYFISHQTPKNQPPISSNDEGELPLMDSATGLSVSSVDYMTTTSSPVKKGKRVLHHTVSTRDDLKALWLPLESLNVNPLKGGAADLKVTTYQGTKLALRCLHYTNATSTERQAFMDAILVVHGLLHPHLTRVEGVSLVNHKIDLAVATEFMPRGSLGAVLTSSADDLSSAQRLRMGLHVVQALQYLHARDIAYNGLHPDKVLVTADLDVKLNVLHLMTPIYHPRRLCPIQCGTGRTRYLAPECRQDVEEGGSGSAAADVYAAGVVLAQLVTGRWPFDTLTKAQGPVHAAVYLHRTPGAMPFDDDALMTLPTELQTLVRACWSVDPASRPSMDDLVAVLERLARDATTA